MDKTLLRILKAINCFSGKMQFSKKYLKYLDEFDIIVTDVSDDTVEIECKLKSDKKKRRL